MLNITPFKKHSVVSAVAFTTLSVTGTVACAGAWCPNIPSGGGQSSEQWFIDKETGETVANGDVVPAGTALYWHRRGRATGSCDIMLPVGISSDCIYGWTQQRTVLKIFGTENTPYGDGFPYPHTHWATRELNLVGGHVLDTTSPDSTGPSNALIGLGSYTFQSAATIQVTECDLQPDEAWSEPTVITGRPPRDDNCSQGGGLGVFGNPCDITRGAKTQREMDLRMGALTLERYYSSLDAHIDMGHGRGWSSFLTRRIERGNSKINLVEKDGRSATFTLSNGIWSGPAGTKYSVSSSADGGYLVRSRLGFVEQFDRKGRLLKATARDGSFLRYVYADSRLPVRVEDTFGRGLDIVEEKKRIKSITPDLGNSIRYEYTNDGSLASVTYGDGTKRSYQYDTRTRNGMPYSALLAGIIDENNSRFAAWHYDEKEKVVSSEHSPDRAGGPVDKYTFAYVDGLSSGVSTATDPMGVTWSVRHFESGGKKFVTQRSNSADDSLISQTFYGGGVRASFTDQLGVRTCFAYNSGQLETHRLEGVPPEQTTACSILARYTNPIPAGTRRIVTAWHPDWDLVTKRSEPGRVTTYVYNGQPDPFNGNAPAACAPASAVLPDGKPIAVLCRQVEQATTDTNGGLGLDALLAPGVPQREQRWTYSRYGQPLSHDGPRTDVADVETYTYYSETTRGFSAGDLASVVNALGQTTRFVRYDPLGQLLQRLEPDGVITDYSYDARQRLTSVSTAGLTTTYAYDAVGQLTRVTQPDGSFVSYEYDAAHRLVAVSDGAGNRIGYTLDNAGHRTTEEVRDPRGLLRRRIDRVMDPLGRVQQVAGGQ